LEKASRVAFIVSDPRIPYFLILSCHELTFLVGFARLIILEDENVSFLSEIDSIQDLNTWASRIKVVMEMINILFRKSLQLLDFEIACH
jgi:hypothetical protein